MKIITLELANENDLDEILKIQKSAFKKLFMKYHDLIIEFALSTTFLA